jgi:pimeloyl-ACP methyl ester carboxylesterase
MRRTPTTRARVRLRAALATLLACLLMVPIAAAATALTPAPAGATPTAPAKPTAPTQAPPNVLPVVFVHGYLGSGAQYRTQAMRFASTGWPADQIRAIDYTGLTAADLNAFIDRVRTEFGVDQVYVAAHSLGTAVMLGYLLNPSQSAKVRAYAALDGVGALCVWGTRCTSISASSMGQTHIEAATSAESFRRQFQHFTGQAPTTTNVVAEPANQVRIGGRALDFTTNAPANGATGQVWPVNSSTGRRTGTSPVATFTVGADGNFGPIAVNGQQHYEIAVARSGVPTVHYYYQPFVRSSYLLRLQTLVAGSPTVTNTNKGPNHAALVVLRYREWWSTGTARDTLQISTSSPSGNQPAVNVLGNLTTNNIAGLHLHDDAATPRQSTLAALPYFSSQPVQTGLDLYMPAATPPNGTIALVNAPRGDTTKLQRINVANWAATGDASLVEFNDYVQ